MNTNKVWINWFVDRWLKSYLFIICFIHKVAPKDTIWLLYNIKISLKILSKINNNLHHSSRIPESIA
jgi:hypothetical protein